MTTKAVSSYVAEAEQLGASRRDTDPAWLVGARRASLERFEALGFPTTRDEEWRFTSVAPIADTAFELVRNGAASVKRDDVAAFGWRAAVAATLVFVNGRFVAALSDVSRLPEGVRAGNLGDLLRRDDRIEKHLTRVADFERHPFTALNTALLADAAVVDIPDSAVVGEPIHLLFLTTAADGQPTMAHPRALVIAGVNSQATIVESYGSSRASAYLTNAVTEIAAGEGARLNHYKIQRESGEGFHVAGMYVRAARDSTVVSHAISLGGALVRNDINVVLDGEGATCTLNGLYVGDGRRLVDNHTVIDHARPRCSSREVYKGILAGHARAVFNGKIVVRPDAQMTDAKQTNKALLLSENAHINTKPQLEIFANDVKCTHGAAVGQMDDEAIFYLRARGLGEREARQLLVRAFAGDVLNQIPLTELRTRVDEDLAKRLPEWLS